MMLRNLILASALCVSSTHAFAFSRPSLTVATTNHRSTTTLNLMSAAEIESIMVEAQDCAEGECAIDEVESLIANLQAQQSLLSKRIEEIHGLITELEHVNGKDERPVDEVRETVRAIFRIFSLGDKASGNNYPSLSAPMGYTGDTKGGGKTAYDVLPPKPMKK